jgi:hypothetical protein
VGQRKEIKERDKALRRIIREEKKKAKDREREAKRVRRETRLNSRLN